MKQMTLKLYGLGLGLTIGLYAVYSLVSRQIEKRILVPSEQSFKDCPQILKEGLTIKEEKSGKEKFRYYERKKGSSLGTLIFFHGSGRSACENREILPNLNSLPLNLVIVEYPGYGMGSEKTNPSQDAILPNALALAKKIQADSSKEERFIVYGASMGTTVATYVASKLNISGLILRNPPTSILETAKKLYPSYLGPFINIGLKSNFPANVWAKKVKAPVLILHAENDEWVPLSLGKKQAKNFVQTKAKFIVIKDAKHMDTFSFPEYKKHLQSFIKKLSK